METSIHGQLDRVFFPRAIAVVGASSNPQKLSHSWVKALMESGFHGGVYAINPNERVILGQRAYASMREVAGPIDLAIVCVPSALCLSVVDDCAAKGVTAAHFFTGGFRETGRPEGRALEDALVARARRTGVRIIGPNCMGVYNPEASIPWGPSDLLGVPGEVGFVSQSGGHAVKMAEIGTTHGIRFSKMVSYGNGADLDSADFIEYLGEDARTLVIGAYLEGTGDGQRLAKVLREVSQVKPVVLWKGGRTWQGAETAASHTGSMMASADVWSGMLRQTGVVHARDMEELADALLLFQQVKRLKGKRMGIVCGLTDGGGGESVLSADACADHGVEVPRFSPSTREGLSSIFGEVGSVLRNPVDVSQGYGDVGKLRQALELVCAEPQIDIVAVYENVEILARFLSTGIMEEMNRLFIEFANGQSRPLVCVLPPGANETTWQGARQVLLAGGIPVFTSMERAARAVANVWYYSAKAKDC